MQRYILAQELHTKLNTESTENIEKLIDTYADIFNPSYLEITLNPYHPIANILTIHNDITFYILHQFKFPLKYVMDNFITEGNFLTDEETAALLQKYKIDFYPSALFDEWRDEYTYTMLATLTEHAKPESVAYLLELGCVQWSNKNTIYTEKESVFRYKDETDTEFNECLKLITDKIHSTKVIIIS